MSADSKLKVIEGGNPKIARPKRRYLGETQQIVCYKCNGSATIDITLAPRRKPNGRATGGTKIKACAFCHSRGEIVELVRG